MTEETEVYEMSGNINKNKKNSLEGNGMREMLSCLGKYKKGIILAACLAVTGSVMNLIGPSALSKVTDLITDGLSGSIDLNAIARICRLLVILYIAGFVLNYLQGFTMATVTQKMTRSLRSEISMKIGRLPLRYFDSHQTGDVLSRVTNDVDSVESAMNNSLSSLVSSLCMLLGSMLMMFLTNWIMAVTGIAAALLGFFVMMQIIVRSQGFYNDQQKDLGRINSHVEEIYSGQMIVKAYNGEKEAKRNFDSLNDSLRSNAWKAQFYSGLNMPLMIFIGNLAYVVVCITGALLAVKGYITFGTIVAFMLYIRLFTQPMQNLSQAVSSVQSMAAACARVFEFLGEQEQPEENDKSCSLSGVMGDVSFKHVCFGYDTDKIIIHDFSAKAEKGQKIAIVGPTGAGKTTIVNLLMRFYEVNSGNIYIDGINTGSVSRENVHDQFAMVLQDTWLFEGSVRDNLVFSQEGITDGEVMRAVEAADLRSLVDSLPDGLDTVLNDQTALSAGQRQLLTIARAMLRKTPLLILDEATSSVDTKTELQVQKAMDELMKGRTSFVIAHRLSTIRNADLILVLRDGDVIESGTHESLLEKNGVYADLYNSQFAAA